MMRPSSSMTFTRLADDDAAFGGTTSCAADGGSLASVGNYYVYDSIGPVADLLSTQLGFSDTQIGTLNAVYSLPNIFMVLIGGMGTMEGPIIGALVLFALQETLSSYGAWYLVVVGGLAIVTTLAASRGLWGLASERFGWSLLPVGYRVRQKE